MLCDVFQVGPRKQNEMTPHNLPMTVMGAGMLWVGWFGFNAGSAAAAGAAAAMAMAVTQVRQAVVETKRYVHAAWLRAFSLRVGSHTQAAPHRRSLPPPER